MIVPRILAAARRVPAVRRASAAAVLLAAGGLAVPTASAQVNRPNRGQPGDAFGYYGPSVSRSSVGGRPGTRGFSGFGGFGTGNPTSFADGLRPRYGFGGRGGFGFGGGYRGLRGFGGTFGYGGLYGLGPGWVPGPYGGAVYGPAIYGPTVGVGPGVVGYGYGPIYPGYGYAVGGSPYIPYSTPLGDALGTSGVGVAGAPLAGPAVGPNAVLDAAAREEADRWRAPVNVVPRQAAPGENLGDPADELLARGERPADERELADALREERRGDEAFARTDYRTALKRYRRAVDLAPFRGDSLYRLAFAELALGNVAGATDDLRRAVELNPSLPTTGATLRELFGGGNGLARTSLMSAAAAHAREDVRDPDRLFLLAATMHANGDSRAREIFEAAWRLTGGRPHLRAYLDPVAVEFGARSGDDAIDAPGSLPDDELPDLPGADAAGEPTADEPDPLPAPPGRALSDDEV